MSKYVCGKDSMIVFYKTNANNLNVGHTNVIFLSIPLPKAGFLENSERLAFF